MSVLDGIAAAPPSFGVDAVAAAVDREFGYRGEFRRLVSERDQNFCLLAADGTRFLVKVTSAVETVATTEFQVGVLRHLEQVTGVDVPRVIPALSGRAWGRIGDGARGYRLRLLSWVDGEPLETLGIDSALAGELGRALGHLDTALAGFVYDGENPVLPWDLQRIGELRPVLETINDRDLRGRVGRAIDDFEGFVVPVQELLPQQVIHADANPENVVACEDGIGFIDFGDIVRAPRVFDPGIAASYLRIDGDDPLARVRPFLAGYHAAAPLAAPEVEVLFDVIRARLAASITLLHWRLGDRPASDDYRRKSLQGESNASHFLAALDALGRDLFLREINRLTLQTAGD